MYNLREGGPHPVLGYAATGNQSGTTVVYLHRGGWIHEASPQHWLLIQQLVAQAGVRMLFPIYPLAQAGGRSKTTVAWVLRLCRSLDGDVVLMGDSAGGTIAMSASIALAQEDRPVAFTALISPAFDLRMTNPEIEKVQPLDP